MPKRKRNVTGFRGISKEGPKYRAIIWVDGKQIYLGAFKTKLEAARAFDHAAMKDLRSTHDLNFPDDVPVGYKARKQKLYKHNTTGYRGACKNGTSFIAQIRKNGKQKSIGRFKTRKGAAIAYDLAAVNLRRPLCDLNFPEMTQEEREAYQEETDVEDTSLSRKKQKKVASTRSRIKKPTKDSAIMTASDVDRSKARSEFPKLPSENTS